jgi:hypothetical protein
LVHIKTISSFKSAALVGIALLLTNQLALASTTKNGFDLTNTLVAKDKILLGGPQRDGIPAIDKPIFISGKQATFLKPDDRILGLINNKQAKAYPIAILNYHEIVNDKVGGDEIAVTYCPLCGSGIAYRSEVEGRNLIFGVSGLLYNSALLLYDRQTESLWSQILGKAISGPMKGTKLETVQLTYTTWRDWLQRYPDTLALSIRTGFQRDYSKEPYAGYEQSGKLWFPVNFRAMGYHPKERIIGIEINGKFKAYPFAELSKTSGEIKDSVNGKKLLIRFDSQDRTGSVFDEAGNELQSVTTFWFAWYAFHNDTYIYRKQ